MSKRSKPEKKGIDQIVVKGAREHNLKNIDITLPRNSFIVITGLSGSGKSTLAFDTIYAEGQRRYVESLSAYARQFLGLMNKPDLDSIDGLSPAISIEQKSTSNNPRSTVGTVTEIYDYLRLLFARIGTPYCPIHNLPIKKKTPTAITGEIQKSFPDQIVTIFSPIIRQKKGIFPNLLSDLKKEGFARVRVDGDLMRTSESVTLDRYKKHDIEIFIDTPESHDRERLADAVELALKKSGGLVLVHVSGDKGEKATEKLYSSSLSCPTCDMTVEELEPRMFSFNSPFGACDECHGLGFKQRIDASLVIPDEQLTIADGAIAAYRTIVDGWRKQQLASVGEVYGFSIFDSMESLTKTQRDAVLYGSKKQIRFKYTSKSKSSVWTNNGQWEGVIPQLERLYSQTESDYRKREIEKFMVKKRCPACEGRRLKREVLSVFINDKNIIDVTDCSISQALTWFEKITLTKKEQGIASSVIKEIRERLSFLKNVGLEYLTLSRSAETLSGGEAQRIRLATQIGANLTGVLYILDEPSIGLHQRDNRKLIETLHRLRDLGNTLIVVEHDEDTIRSADYVVDMGPGAGIHGGEVVAQGTPKQIEKNKKSLTGSYLAGHKSIAVPEVYRKPVSFITIKGASEHNLKNITARIPTKVLCSITGVSGSGKSTLIYDILYKAIMRKLYHSRDVPGAHEALCLPSEIDKVILIDQSPIGRTPRSNPATYIKVFDEIRALYALTKESKSRGFEKGRFSFNVSGGRCEACKGDGLIKIEMNFLPDVYVVCEDCKGQRYNAETLEVLYKGKNIAQVLDMSVEEAYDFFQTIPSIERRLKTLLDVGLGYIKLGQSSTTLSGGEAQRIKLTRELAQKATGNTLYLLDEPTTGLHFHDVKKLIDVFGRLVDKGNTIVVIEHNLDVIKSSDYIIDLGPEGGDKGGEIIAQGSPHDIVTTKESHTGQFLLPLLAHVEG